MSPLGCSRVELALTGRIGWTANVYNEELFRVFEYGAMSVYLCSRWAELTNQGGF
jgi:hypothetical protein